MYFKGKKILVLSPQSWGAMLLSKHQYAIALAKSGSEVYFLNPPSEGREAFRITRSEHTPGLHLIDHTLAFPYRLKFHLPSVFHFLMGFHVRRLLRRIGPVDIVWSFDLGNLYPFGLFGKQPLKIFHPVDEPLHAAALQSGKGADVLFSVTREILQKYPHPDSAKHHVHHGVSDEFLTEKRPPYDGRIRAGISGNMIRRDLDRDTLLRIVSENPDVTFECWGAYEEKQSNIGGGAHEDTAQFIDALRRMPNFIFHGPVSPARLAEELPRMDLFLICYDIEKDQSKGTNYHKVMEYLSTGRVVVSNNITTYQPLPGLIEMSPERTNNNSLPALFRTVVDDLAQHNSEERQAARRAFARDNSYARQLARISDILSASGK